MLRWSAKECERRGLEPTPDRKRFCLGDALFHIRYLTLTAAQFASGPAKSGLLTQQESFAVLMNISSPGNRAHAFGCTRIMNNLIQECFVRRFGQSDTVPT
jgi:hypothetical protein